MTKISSKHDTEYPVALKPQKFWTKTITSECNHNASQAHAHNQRKLQRTTYAYAYSPWNKEIAYQAWKQSHVQRNATLAECSLSQSIQQPTHRKTQLQYLEIFHCEDATHFLRTLTIIAERTTFDVPTKWPKEFTNDGLKAVSPNKWDQPK